MRRGTRSIAALHDARVVAQRVAPEVVLPPGPGAILGSRYGVRGGVVDALVGPDFDRTALDLNSSVTVAGTVREFRFTSPHARIYFDVVGKDGVVERWLAEGANAAALRHIGWTAAELNVGERITLTGFPARDGSHTLEWSVITRADGTRLGGGNNLPQERAELLERLEAQRRAERPRE